MKLKGKALSADDYVIDAYYNNLNKGTATMILRGVQNVDEDGNVTGCGGIKVVRYKIIAMPFGYLWYGNIDR